jgi:hypothetical protein
LIACQLVPTFWAFASAEEGEKPKPPLTEQEQEETVEKLLKESRALTERSRAAIARTDELLLRILTLRMVAWEPTPAPPKLDPKTRLSRKRWVRRGLKWLAAQQESGGFWAFGSDAAAVQSDALATRVILTADRELDFVRNARVWFDHDRISSRGRPLYREFGNPKTPVCPKSLALVILADCSDFASFRRAAKPDIERMAARLVKLANKKGTWSLRSDDAGGDPITTAWAQLALTSCRERGTAITTPRCAAWPKGVEGSAIANAWREIALAKDSECLGEQVERRISKLLVGDLRTRPSRSLVQWYLGALALKRVGGDSWEHWRKGALQAIAEAQRPDGAWGDGGKSARIRSSALALLCVHAVVSFD